MIRRCAIGALAFGLAALAAMPRPDAHRELKLAAVRGPLVLASSAEGTALVGARDMRPGSSASGVVTLMNASGEPAHLYLQGSPARERLGAGGGSLAAALRLSMRDRGGRELVTGDVHALGGCHDLGVIGARERRELSFTAAFPRGGAQDNSYAGSSTSVDLRWTEQPPDSRGCAGVAAAQRLPRAVLSHRRVALVRGHALIRLLCRGTGAGRCAGTVALERAPGRSRLSPAGVYGRAPFAIRVGGAGTVRVRAPLRRRKAIATAVVRSGGTTSRRRITLISR